MRRKVLTTVLLALGLGLTARSQGTVTDLGCGTGGRISAGADWKLAKGLHLTGEVELRTRDDFSALGRVQADLGLSYKFTKWLKASAGYVFIENKNSSGIWKPRHRFYADATGTLKAGDWRFSLKEKVQLTHKDGVNAWQTTPNSLASKTRLKVSYKGFGAISPYAAAELRIVLNDPSCVATWNGSSYSNYQFLGYSDAYANRIRGILGAEWKLDKRNSLDVYLMGDRYFDKVVDTNKAGTELKSLTYEKGFLASFCLGYKFSF